MDQNQKLSLRETQLALLEVVKKIDSICKKEEIQYWVNYGSLIGAIRHKGFIPWDDDFDIGMSRPDYEKFLKYCYNNKQSLYPFDIHNTHTQENCWYNISRFCDNRYVCKFDKWAGYDESGLFVDIYPYDGQGTKNDKYYWFKKDKIRCYYLMMIGLSSSKKFEKSKIFVKTLIRMFFYPFAKMHKPVFYLKKMEKIATKYSWNESDYVFCTVWTSYKKMHFLKKEYFEDFIEVDFENLKVPVPKKYNDILTDYYGDYMKLPPEEERNPQHFYQTYRKTNIK